VIPAARIAAAIEVLGDVEARRRPAPDALKEWGLSHRFAGSKDRAAIASLVYDALRRKASSAWLMGEGTPRAVVIGMLRQARAVAPDGIAALSRASASPRRRSPLPKASGLRPHRSKARRRMSRGDFPDWIEPSLARLFGANSCPRCRRSRTRAPRTSAPTGLKTSRRALQDGSVHAGPIETPHSPSASESR
jgi:16S rRNA (cytosine967-C5)-methyltransferase